MRCPHCNKTIQIYRNPVPTVDIIIEIGATIVLIDPWGVLPQIRHAGAIFLGHHTPEAAGDYLAGPNHVLPTMGTARYSSALGVETFLKKSSIISYSRQALEEDGDRSGRNNALNYTICFR